MIIFLALASPISICTNSFSSAKNESRYYKNIWRRDYANQKTKCFPGLFPIFLFYKKYLKCLTLFQVCYDVDIWAIILANSLQVISHSRRDRQLSGQKL